MAAPGCRAGSSAPRAAPPPPAGRAIGSAAAVVRIGNMKMAGAIRMVSISLGADPRDFALFAFGGLRLSTLLLLTQHLLNEALPLSRDSLALFHILFPAEEEPAVHKGLFRFGVHRQGMIRPDHQVGVLTHLYAADSIVDVQQFCRVEGDKFQGILF